MSSFGGLMKNHHYWLTQAAWQDWRWLDNQATAAGRCDLIDLYRPPENAGWRTVDKRINQVCQILGWPIPEEMRRNAARGAE